MKNLGDKAPKEAVARLVALRDVQVEDNRGRKDFASVPELMKSIQESGLINPITVQTTAAGIRLLAGESRFRACTLLGWTHIPAFFRDELSDIQAKTIELKENIVRKDLEWTEQIELLRQIDELKRDQYGSVSPGERTEPGAQEKWTTEKTAELVGMSRSHTHAQILFAKRLQERPDLKEKVKGLPLKVAMRVVKAAEENEALQRKHKAGLVDLRTNLKLGSCLDLIKEVESESVSLVLTDPPFGLESLEASDKTRARKASTTRTYATTLLDNDNSSGSEVLQLLAELIPELFRVLKPRAHFYMFYGAQFHSEIRKLLLDAGFLVQETPIIEQILFAHKPPRERRLAKSCKAILTFAPTGASSKTHPFQKPLPLLKYFEIPHHPVFRHRRSCA